VAVDLALASVGGRGRVPTFPAVVEALLEPTTEAAGAIRTDRATLLEDGRDVALELRRLVHGDLRGMFDGTNI
jgi:sirohydrochlorin ferrochelatase